MSFVEHQLATSQRPVAGPAPIGAVFDFMFVGLNRQIEHHLFRGLSVSVAKGAPGSARLSRAWLSYNETTYRRAVGDVARHFARTGRLARRDAAWRLSSESPRV
jgi:hypothetical protein